MIYFADMLDNATKLRLLSVAHIITGTLLIGLGVADGLVGLTLLNHIFMGVWSGIWVCTVCGSLSLSPDQTVSCTQLLCQHSLNNDQCVSIAGAKTCTRHIMRLDELSLALRLERRTKKDSSSRCIIILGTLYATTTATSR